MSEELNEKQLIFCEEYLKIFNATQAAINAGYSKKSAYSYGHDLLKDERIKQYIAQRMTSLVMGTDEFLYLLGKRARDESNPAIQLRALELVGRTKAMFLDRTDVTSQGQSISLADYINGIVQARSKPSNITVLE